jgi:hypothetical protein
MTEVNFEEITGYQRYKLMASLIVPRPIALYASGKLTLNRRS